MRPVGHLTKAFLVLLCLSSWLVASNHCALAALQLDGPTQSCCSDRSKVPAPESASMVCCKVLKLVEQGNIVAPGASVALQPESLYLACDFLFPVFVGEQIADVRPADPPLCVVAFAVDLVRCHPAIAPPLFS